MRRITGAAGAAVLTGGVVFGAAPALAMSYEGYASYGLGIAGSNNHRHPVPGELQLVRWTVANTGTQAWSRVRLRVTVPADWRLRAAPGCRAYGPHLSCELGRLAARARAHTVIRMVVPRRPRYGTVPIRGIAKAWSGRYAFPGPSTTFPVTVVPHR